MPRQINLLGAYSATVERSGCSHEACRGIPSAINSGSAGEKLLTEIRLKHADQKHPEKLASSLYVVCHMGQILLQEMRVVYCCFPASVFLPFTFPRDFVVCWWPCQCFWLHVNMRTDSFLQPGIYEQRKAKLYLWLRLDLNSKLFPNIRLFAS